MKKQVFLILIASVCMVSSLQAQKVDSLITEHKRILQEHSNMLRNVLDSLKKLRIIIGQKHEDVTYTGTSIISQEERSIEEPKLAIGGYISTYYAHYSDSVGYGNFQKFPTAAPRNDQFSLNIAQLNMKYSSRTARATVTLHYGDMPASVWSPVYNVLQEANAGIRLHKKLWLDAGLFRTHIGLESIQPRENITTNIALVTFNEPYYLAGAKLSYLVNNRLVLQLNSFNSYNGFVESNRKKAVGFSALYELSKMSITFNTLWNDDSPDSSKVAHGRLYNNLYAIYRTNRLVLGVEANYATQQNTSLDTSKKTSTAWMWSALISAKYRLLDKFYTYAKLEYYQDQQEMLTGPIIDSRSMYVGLEIGGATVGVEWKPLGNCYLRLESRVLQTTDNEKIFRMNGSPSASRYEMIGELGVWF